MGRLGLLIVTHGRLSEELVDAAQTILGPQPNIIPVSLGWNDAVSASEQALRQAIDSLEGESGVVVLTDMFGGTPTNLSLALHESDRVEVVTGVNLPMVIRFCSIAGEGLDARTVAQKIAEQGREAIHVATDLLERALPTDVDPAAADR